MFYVCIYIYIYIIHDLTNNLEDMSRQKWRANFIFDCHDRDLDRKWVAAERIDPK